MSCRGLLPLALLLALQTVACLEFRLSRIA
jgi:hypothetical protein